MVTIALRDVTTAIRLDETVPAPAGVTSVNVPFRQGAPGVIDMRELGKRIAAQQATKVDSFDGAGVQSAEMAMEMLQFPYRQVFGDPAKSKKEGAKALTYDQVFHPTISLDTLREWEAGGGE